jgi:hypothetical protein
VPEWYCADRLASACRWPRTREIAPGTDRYGAEVTPSAEGRWRFRRPRTPQRLAAVAARLADRQRAPVLGVNLGKLGLLAEVDVPDLPAALSAIDDQAFTIEPRLAVGAVTGSEVVTAFNDVAVVRGAAG